jgi:hypothetical protein
MHQIIIDRHKEMNKEFLIVSEVGGSDRRTERQTNTRQIE